MRCESQTRSTTDRTAKTEHSSETDDAASAGRRDVGDANDQQTDDGRNGSERAPTDEATRDGGQTETAEQGVADGENETADSPVELSQDLRFDALQNERRRETITYLRAHDGSATLGELAEHIAAIENDTTVQALSSQQRKRVYVGLYQGHLPKLDDMNVVDFDRDRGDVELGPNAPQLYPYLPSLEAEKPRPWDLYYVGCAVASVALLGIATVGNLLSWAGLALLSILTLGLCALTLAHVASRRR